SAIAELVICTYCDVVHERVELATRKTARCMSCDRPLHHSNADLGGMLAVTITAAIAFAIANAFPLVTLTMNGRQTEATLWRAITASYVQDLPAVAVALALTLIVAPRLELGLLLWVLTPLVLRTRAPGFRTAMRLMRMLRPWRMVEVFLLGVAVAVVKLSGLASVTPGWGLFGVAVMTLALASLASFDQGALWRRADELGAAA
ncbi:MAG: paraquat-inducible protein A, partial [Kofleriaceae bacterium]